MKPRYLVDTSALVRLTDPAVAAVLDPLIIDGAVALSTPVLLEALYAARASDYPQIRAGYETATTILPLTPRSQPERSRCSPSWRNGPNTGPPRPVTC